uniref:hypothetical protein n=1 Tax=uncultured Dysgonomonas sp. TaxID=206096 RepID=UPI002616CBB2|nr:hypothetical protein [uncultured Dysgonomonas sp.]
MRKKIYLFPLFLLGFFMLATTSCLNSNNNNEEDIDEEWKALNETRFAKVASDNSFNALSSQSGNGKVYWQTSTEITNVDEGNSVRITVEGKPEFTDTIVVRYEAWYFDKVGDKIIFDSTENPSLKTKINYTYGESSTDPNYKKVTFPINSTTLYGSRNNNYIEGVEGCSVLLQDMLPGNERVVCMSQELGFGRLSATHSPQVNGTLVSGAPTFTLVPAYTTVWYRIKLYKIIPMKGLK